MPRPTSTRLGGPADRDRASSGIAAAERVVLGCGQIEKSVGWYATLVRLESLGSGHLNTPLAAEASSRYGPLP